jgi:uncharacterized protein DUF4124
MVPKFALAILLLVAAVGARADVYRWVDENGKTHYGEVVPEKYKQKSRRVDGTGPEVTGAQRREAEERAAREKARLDALEKSRDAKDDAAQRAAGSAPVAQAGSECEEQMNRYLESLACFDKYRNAQGRGAKVEGFQECKVVSQPQGCTPKPESSERPYLPPAQ